MTQALIVIDVQNDFCPGGALPALGTGERDVFVFVAAMIVGILATKRFQKMQRGRQTATA